LRARWRSPFGHGRISTNLRKTWLALVGAIVILALFTALGELAVGNQTLALDRATMLWLHQATSPELTTALGIATNLGTFAVAGTICLIQAIAYFWAGARRAALALAVAVGMEPAIDALTKEIFARPRPELWPHLATATGFSYPSGHILLSTVAYGLSAILLSRWASWKSTPNRGTATNQVGAPGCAPQATNQIDLHYFRVIRLVAPGITVALIGVVAVSRVYLGVHYPTDVVGGLLLGLAWGGFWLAVIRPWPRERRASCHAPGNPPTTGGSRFRR
jgi:undecaprenyl-diphosphatase